MSLIHTIHQKLHPKIPQHLKTKIRLAVEYLFDLGKKPYFSQFGEDAFLQGYFESKAWRQDKFKSLPFSRPKFGRGFYVDVGAFSPKQYSNTYSFYRQGWRGINIDATPGSMRAFNLIRRHDINIEAVISNQEKELVFYYWSIPGLINTLSRQIAEQWKKELGREPKRIRVKTVRLEMILDEYLPKDQEISFMTIDTEGHDLEVLQANNWEKYRPELVVVEDHEDYIERILNSAITTYLREVRYKLYSWIKPSVIYKNEDLVDTENT